MTLRIRTRHVGAAMVLVMLASGCSRERPTEPWPPDTDPVVFRDAFGANVGFQAFAGSKLDALTTDTVEHHAGTASLRFTVPGPGDPTGGYAGGAFVAGQARSLAGYNALSFWVKASRATILETAGFGNDNTGTSHYEARRTSIPMTTAWTHVLIPIPLASKLTRERGLFYLAEGPQTGAGLTFWVDDIEFVNDPTITNPRPLLTSQTINAIAGTAVDLNGATRTTFAVAGLDQTVSHMAGYFSFQSSDPTVATVNLGVAHVLGAGTTTLTARLGALDASGSITLNASVPPATAAPAPTLPSSVVLSLFSDVYANVPVDNWRAFGTPAVQVQDVAIAGNATKLYSGLAGGYVGIAFPPIDATAMTHFHLDVWATAGSTLRVKLVDFGADGVFGGGDDTQDELTFDAASTPPLAPGAWVSLEIPLTSFANLASRAHVAQLILSGDTPGVFVDNIYFHH